MFQNKNSLSKERIVDRLIRKQVHVDDMQFGFMWVCCTTVAILIVRELHEKKRKKLFYTWRRLLTGALRRLYGG